MLLAVSQPLEERLTPSRRAGRVVARSMRKSIVSGHFENSVITA